jgi:Protein of unknown function (DUF2938)
MSVWKGQEINQSIRNNEPELEGKRMSSMAEIFLKATLVGVGGTIVLDLYALMMSRVLGVPSTSWATVGRWFGNDSWPIRSARDDQGRAGQGRTDDRLDRALRTRHRLWTPAGSAVGQGLAGATDTPSSDDPRLLVAPYFMMMPGMGMGIAGSRTPQPNVTRLRSVMGHSVFGLGMYATGRLLALYWPTSL